MILKNEGFFALYKGFLFNCITIVNGPIYLGMLEKTKLHLININD